MVNDILRATESWRNGYNRLSALHELCLPTWNLSFPRSLLYWATKLAYLENKRIFGGIAVSFPFQYRNFNPLSIIKLISLSLYMWVNTHTCVYVCMSLLAIASYEIPPNLILERKHIFSSSKDLQNIWLFWNISPLVRRSAIFILLTVYDPPAFVTHCKVSGVPDLVIDTRLMLWKSLQ